MPVGALEEVDKVDAERLFRLPHLPVLDRAALFEVFAEPSDLIGQRLVGSGSVQEAAHPADVVGRGVLLDESILEDELGELL